METVPFCAPLSCPLSSQVLASALSCWTPLSGFISPLPLLPLTSSATRLPLIFFGTWLPLCCLHLSGHLGLVPNLSHPLKASQLGKNCSPYFRAGHFLTEWSISTSCYSLHASTQNVRDTAWPGKLIPSLSSGKGLLREGRAKHISVERLFQAFPWNRIYTSFRKLWKLKPIWEPC